MFYTLKIKDNVKASVFEKEIENYVNQQRKNNIEITGLLLGNKHMFVHFMETKGSHVIEEYLKNLHRDM